MRNEPSGVLQPVTRTDESCCRAWGPGLTGHDTEFDNLVKGLLPTQLLVIGTSPLSPLSTLSSG
jgi:hypothetical protein